MTTVTLLHVGLIFHIIGITMMAGTTFADFITFRQFWKQLPRDKQKAILINIATAKFPVFIGIGAVLLILSGITMMAVLHGVLDTQTWFRIKMALVLLIILNAVIIGRPQNIKLKKMLLSDIVNGTSIEFNIIKKRIRLFHVLQFTMFVLIFILSVFRFE
jgi:hypothetical protein